MHASLCQNFGMEWNGPCLLWGVEERWYNRGLGELLYHLIYWDGVPILLQLNSLLGLAWACAAAQETFSALRVQIYNGAWS